ncbi:DUF4199 domain-containing protein [Salinimicrobium soli]|uniref:DUF4199 domain-containing protein n=1 Tax=Salinimicrobium soli TaxID=1254399 RepID=UPI003AACBA5D
MEKSPKSIGATYGVYLGAIMILLTALAYAFSLDLFTKWWFGILSFLVLLVVSILAVRNAKKHKISYFSFKNAFTAYFVTVFVGMLIATVFSILLFTVIDPEAAEVVAEKTMEASRAMMENFGAPEASIDEALAEMQNNNQFSVGNQLKRFVYSLGFYLIIGLIIALIFKERNPEKV